MKEFKKARNGEIQIYDEVSFYDEEARPVLILTAEEAAMLVVTVLRGATGPQGPTGPMGMSSH